MTPYMSNKMKVLEEDVFQYFVSHIKVWKCPAIFLNEQKFRRLNTLLGPQKADKAVFLSIYQPMTPTGRVVRGDAKRTAYIFGFNIYSDTDHRDVDDKHFPYYALGFNVRKRLIAAKLLVV